MRLPTVNVGDHREDRHLGPTCQATGTVRSGIFQPAGFSLWQVEAELAEGSVLRWGPEHADEVLFVLHGCVEVEGQRCGVRSVVVIESEIQSEVRALADTTLLHFGSEWAEQATRSILGPPSNQGRGVHVTHPEHVAEIGAAEGPGTRVYVDSTCPTCRAALLEVHASRPYETEAQLHSQDQLIRVLDGTVTFGYQRAPAGTSIAIPADCGYALQTRSAFSYVSYRRDASAWIGERGLAPRLETARGLCGHNVPRP